MENTSLELLGQGRGFAYMYTNEVGRVQKDGEADLISLFGSLDPTMPEADPWVLLTVLKSDRSLSAQAEWSFLSFAMERFPHTFGRSKK